MNEEWTRGAYRSNLNAPCITSPLSSSFSSQKKNYANTIHEPGTEVKGTHSRSLTLFGLPLRPAPRSRSQTVRSECRISSWNLWMSPRDSRILNGNRRRAGFYESTPCWHTGCGCGRRGCSFLSSSLNSSFFLLRYAKIRAGGRKRGTSQLIATGFCKSLCKMRARARVRDPLWICVPCLPPAKPSSTELFCVQLIRELLCFLYSRFKQLFYIAGTLCW